MTVSSVDNRALFLAVDKRDATGLTTLLHTGKGDPNSRNVFGDPLVVYAARKIFSSGIRALVECGSSKVDINAKDGRGDTALHIAVQMKNFLTMHCLLKGGACRNIRNRRGDSVLHLAAGIGDKVLLKCLLDNVSSPCKRLCALNLDAINDEGQTPLIKAAYNAHVGVMRLLLEAGARSDIKDSVGYTLGCLVLFKGLIINKSLWERTIGLYEIEFMRRKMLAHVNDLGGMSHIGSSVFNLSGAFPPYMQYFFYNKLEKFFLIEGCTLYKFREMLLDAFAGTARSPKEIERLIRRQELVILSTGWIGHAINLVFYRGYMAICNPGETISCTAFTIELCLVDPHQITVQVIKQIRSMPNVEKHRAIPYFYRELPKQLAKGMPLGVLNRLWYDMMRMAPRRIKSGSCSYGALTAALRASIFLLRAVNIEPQHYRLIANISKMEAKSIATFVCLDEMKRYLKHYSSPEEIKENGDLNLVQRALALTCRSVRKEKYYIQLFDRSLKEIMDHCQRLQLQVEDEGIS